MIAIAEWLCCTEDLVILSLYYIYLFRRRFVSFMLRLLGAALDEGSVDEKLATFAGKLEADSLCDEVHGTCSSSLA